MGNGDKSKKSYSFRLNQNCESDNIIGAKLDEINKAKGKVSDYIKDALIHYIKYEKGEISGGVVTNKTPSNTAISSTAMDLEMINSIVSTLKVVNDTSLEIYNKMKDLTITGVTVSSNSNNSGSNVKEETKTENEEDIDVISLNKDTEEEIDDETMASLLDFMS